MAETVIPEVGRQDSASAHLLWTFMTAISGVSDELEQARLIATGVPALLPCRLSGLALVDESETTWSLIVQKDGYQVDSPQTEQICVELEPLFQEALRSPTLLVATIDGETDDVRIPPSIKNLGLQSLAVAPLRTVHHVVGMLFAGREELSRFSQEEERILSTLAEHSAIGIENLRLHQSLQEYSIDLQRQNERILHAAGEGIYGLDLEGKTTFVNPAAAKMLGWEVEGLTGQPMHAVLHHSRPDGSPYPREECPIYVAFKDGKVHRADDEVFWRKDGSSFPVEYTSTPIRDHGKLAGAVVVFWDITERKQAEEALHKAHAEVQHLKERLQAENIYLQEEIKTQHNFEEVIGNSSSLQEVLRKVEQVAPTEATVLIHGETGTGKELIARAIHNLSSRKDRPLVKVNCGAISAGLVESELFGHEKGAFTGALQQRTGRFELANGGTIFLDEVGELPLDTQVMLLRVLQEQEFERVGSSQSIHVDVRVIAATNRDLAEAVKAGKFRMDLFYRLNVFPLAVPPLRERTSDIPLLAARLLGKLAKNLGKPLHGISPKSMDYLMHYPWPGNVRELENVIERAAIVAQGPIVEIDKSLAPETSGPSQGAGTRTLEEVERAHILSVLEKANWTISGERGAAAVLGLNPSTLRSRIQKLGIRR